MSSEQDLTFCQTCFFLQLTLVLAENLLANVHKYILTVVEEREEGEEFTSP